MTAFKFYRSLLFSLTFVTALGGSWACKTQKETPGSQPKGAPQEPVIVGVAPEDQQLYKDLAKRARARELCVLQLQHATEVVVEAGRTQSPTEEVAKELCQRGRVVQPFVKIESDVWQKLQTVSRQVPLSREIILLNQGTEETTQDLMRDDGIPGGVLDGRFLPSHVM